MRGSSVSPPAHLLYHTSGYEPRPRRARTVLFTRLYALGAVNLAVLDLFARWAELALWWCSGRHDVDDDGVNAGIDFENSSFIHRHGFQPRRPARCHRPELLGAHGGADQGTSTGRARARGARTRHRSERRSMAMANVRLFPLGSTDQIDPRRPSYLCHPSPSPLSQQHTRSSRRTAGSTASSPTGVRLSRRVHRPTRRCRQPRIEHLETSRTLCGAKGRMRPFSPAVSKRRR